jgi:hypothetical protein
MGLDKSKCHALAETMRSPCSSRHDHDRCRCYCQRQNYNMRHRFWIR